jgi:hypothetical protein
VERVQGESKERERETEINDKNTLIIQVLTLTKNIRAQSDEEFSKFLEQTGEGKFKEEHLPYVMIDKPGVMMPSQSSLLQSIYEGKLNDEDYLYKSCVLCTTNRHAEYVNNVVSLPFKMYLISFLLIYSDSKKLYEQLPGSRSCER